MGLILCLSNKLPEDGDDDTTHPPHWGAAAALRQPAEIYVPVVDGSGIARLKSPCRVEASTH